MITNFKIFETVNQLPKIGDWLILRENFFPKWFWKNNSRIFQIKKINKEHGCNSYEYTIEINDKGIKEYGIGNSRKISITDFDFWSSDKEELESIIAANKYNL